MSRHALDELQCPICLDTLRKPIRMLLCGHNLCQICLFELFGNDKQAKCPTCRQEIILGFEGILGLPRNLAIESVIEKLNDDINQTQLHSSSTSQLHSSSTSQLPHSSTSQPQTKLKRLADSLIAQDEYQNALEILTAIIDQSQGVDKVPLMVKKIKCLLILDEIEDAKETCLECSATIQSCRDEEIVKETCDGCDDEMKMFTETFLEMKECDVGIGLANSLFKLIKCLRQGKDKLIKLQKLGAVFQRFAEEMANQNRAAEFRPQLETMEEILNEIQIISDVDVRIKCLQATWFMKYFGCACNDIKEYSRSIEINNRAINSMLLVFGNEAHKYRVLGFCYHNIGVAYDGRNRPNDAKASFRKSIDVKASATDFVNEEDKDESILISTRSLNLVNKKIQKK